MDSNSNLLACFGKIRRHHPKFDAELLARIAILMSEYVGRDAPYIYVPSMRTCLRHAARVSATRPPVARRPRALARDDRQLRLL